MFTEVTHDPSGLISTQLDSDVYVGTGVFFVVAHYTQTVDAQGVVHSSQHLPVCTVCKF